MNNPNDYALELDGWLYLPYSNFANPNTIRSMKNYLTIRSKFKYDPNGEEILPIPFYDDQPENQRIGVPIRWGLNKFAHLVQNKIIKDNLVKPKFVAHKFSKEPDLYHEKASKDQPECVALTLKALQVHNASLLVAPTGSGKTVMSCAIIAKINTPTLIIVHNQILLEQWKYELIDKLGLKEEEIGLIQGATCRYQNYPVCIGSLQTLCKGKFNEQIRDKFGLIILDEVHKAGAPKLSGVIGTFSARYQLALTATPSRKDGRESIFLYYFGTGDATAKAAALPIKVNILPYNASMPNWGKDRNQKIMCISRDKKRNALISSLIKQLYATGRNILIVSEYKAQLISIKKLLIEAQVPEDDIGDFYNGAIESNKKADNKAHFQRVMDSCPIILATYGMVKEGVSINRLDAGIDATPRSDATQLIGRIRRPYQNKLLPIWYTINDVNDPVLRNFTEARVKDYSNDASVELVRHDLEYLKDHQKKK